jgi:hypothetical protein
MKKLLIAILTLSSVSSFAQKKADDVAKFNVETYDYGKIKQNIDQLPEHKATATFIVTNIGKEDLLIEEATPSCGCTFSDYTKTPIAPGKTGIIHAIYNAANLGHFDKTLTIKFSGIDDKKPIKLTGEVLDAASYDKAVAAGEIKKAVAPDSTSTTTKKMKKDKKTTVSSTSKS